MLLCSFRLLNGRHVKSGSVFTIGFELGDSGFQALGKATGVRVAENAACTALDYISISAGPPVEGAENRLMVFQPLLQ